MTEWCIDNGIDDWNRWQELNARAAGESLVRQALVELEQWEVESVWSLTEHVDSSGHRISIIKEFKELLNKVNDYESYSWPPLCNLDSNMIASLLNSINLLIQFESGWREFESHSISQRFQLLPGLQWPYHSMGN